MKIQSNRKDTAETSSKGAFALYNTTAQEPKTAGESVSPRSGTLSGLARKQRALSRRMQRN